MQLRDLQTAFASALSGKDEEALLASIESAGDGRDQRLSVYRNNMQHNYSEALRAVYPVVERLVGDRFFRYAADCYMRRYPSDSGDIHVFGNQFFRFLHEFPPAAELGYLPDMARLEWMMHEAFHAPDHAPLALDRLQHMPQEQYATLRFVLHPACRLLSSPYPLQAIWKANQPSAEWEGVLEIGGAGVSLLIRRGSDFIVELVTLSNAEFSMVYALSEGRPLGAAYEHALQEDASFDLSGFILRHVTEGSIVDFRVGPGDLPHFAMRTSALGTTSVRMERPASLSE